MGDEKKRGRGKGRKKRKEQGQREVEGGERRKEKEGTEKGKGQGEERKNGGRRWNHKLQKETTKTFQCMYITLFPSLSPFFAFQRHFSSVNANQITENRGGLGTRLVYVYTICT